MKKALLLLATTVMVAAFAHGQKVAVAAVAGKAKANKIPVTVTLTIPEGYHIYSSKPAETGIPTSIKSKSPNFKIVSSTYPKTKPFTTLGETVQVYEGKAIVKLMVQPTKAMKGKQTLKLAVTSQACDDRTCLPPDTKEITVTVTLS